MQEKLILRAVTSPYDDETKGSVLSHQELDSNFVFLKGLDIKSIEIEGNTLIVYRNNEDALTVDLTTIAGTPGPQGPAGPQGEAGAQGPVGPQGEFSATVTGGTYDINTGVITLYNNDQTIVNIAGILNIVSGTADSTLGTLTLTRNDGSSFTVTGFSTGATSSDSITYTNLVPSTQEVGGISGGTTFNNDTIKSIFDRLFYKYQAPSFTAFDNGSLDSIYELGQKIPIGSQTFTFTISQPANVTNGTVAITQLVPSTIVLASGGNTTPTSSAFTITQSYSSTSITTSSVALYRISATPTQGAQITRNISANWRVRWYWGQSVNATLTAAEITGLTNDALIAAGGAVSTSKTFPSTTPGKYCYFAIPSICSQPSRFVQAVSSCVGNPVAMQTLSDVTFNNPYGVSITYKMYRTFNILTASQDIYLCS